VQVLRPFEISYRKAVFGYGQGEAGQTALMLATFDIAGCCGQF